MSRLLFHVVDLCGATRLLSVVVQSIKKLLRDLLDLLVFLSVTSDSVILFSEKRSLSLNDLPDLILLFTAEANFTLVQQSTQKLTALDLLTKLSLTDV